MKIIISAVIFVVALCILTLMSMLAAPCDWQSECEKKGAMWVFNCQKEVKP